MSALTRDRDDWLASLAANPAGVLHAVGEEERGLAEASQADPDDGMEPEAFRQGQRAQQRRAQAAAFGAPPVTAQPRPRTAGALQPLSWTDVLSHRDEPVRQLVDGIIPEAALTVLAGPPKIGKSLLLDQIGVAVASASVGEILGRPVRRHGPVLLIFEEGTLEGIGYRLRRQAGALLATDPELQVLHLARIRLDNRQSVQTLRALVRDLQPVMVGLDPLNRLHGADENRPSQMTPVMNALAGIAYDFGCSVVTTHHLAKPSVERRGSVWDRFRGASSIRSGTDANLALDGNGTSVRLEGEFRDMEPLKLHLEMDRDALLFRPGEAPKAPSKIDADDLLAFVQERERVGATDVMDRFECSRHTALDALDAHPDLDYAPGLRGARLYFIAGAAA